MPTNNNSSSLKSLAFNALERLEKNKSKVQIFLPMAKPITHGVGGHEVGVYTMQPPIPQSTAMLPLSSISEEYEERLAIAEHDGQQTSTQAQRIAYVDAFVSVLVTLSYDEGGEDWLDQRVKAGKKWLLNQGIDQPK